MFGFFKPKKRLTRKERTEKFLEEKRIKINYNLPRIESEKDTTIRNPKEIAQRVVVLAVTNMVAFSGMTGQQAIAYLKQYDVWKYVTDDEKSFLENPTPERKNQASWQCEGIWVLMWSLGAIDELLFPDKMCDLNSIPGERYPIGPNKDPNEFINRVVNSRTKTEILDANDLYYRINWACVDARLNGLELNVNPGVVYERHYALNWLINYMQQDWDDISTDT